MCRASRCPSVSTAMRALFPFRYLAPPYLARPTISEVDCKVRPSKTAVGCGPLPRRWVVERSFAWLGKQRRLSKDYEEKPVTSEAFIQVAMTALMLRRLTPT